MNYQSVFNIAPPTGADAGTTWSYDAALLPNIVAPIYVYRDCTVGGLASQTRYNFLNTQLDGSTIAEKYQSLISLAERWRLAYMSVTVVQDGADLTNQGMLAVCQTPNAPIVTNVCMFNTYAGQQSALISSGPHLSHWSVNDRPNFERSQAMPNAYLSRSREGAYVPLKLTRSSQNWQSDADHIGINEAFVGDPLTGMYAISNAPGAVDAYPFPSAQRFAYTGVAPNLSVSGTIMPPMANDNVAHFSVRNAAVTTSFSLYVRMGWEMQVNPTSELAPQLKLSPPYDPQALKAYFAISRELKDAYPADYNDLGKIWDTISAAAKSIAPMLFSIPKFGPIIGGAVTGVTTIGDGIRASQIAKQAGSQPEQQVTARALQTRVSAGDLERARERLRPVGYRPRFIQARPRALKNTVARRSRR